MKKYELTNEKIKHLGKTLYRIRSLRNFGVVQIGDLGGYIESEKNLSHEGDCWVYGDAMVGGDARVYGYAEVGGDARVYGYAEVGGDAEVGGNARVHGDAEVYGNAWVYGDAMVGGDARVYGYAEVGGDARVYGYAEVGGDARVYGYAEVGGNAEVCGNAWVCRNAEIYKDNHLLNVGAIGSRNDYTTFYRSNDNVILVRCGCFSGNIEEFEKAVEKTHKGNKHEKAYKLAIQLAKINIKLERD